MTPLDMGLSGCTLAAVIFLLAALAGNAKEHRTYQATMREYAALLLTVTGERNTAIGQREYYRLQMLMAVAALQQQSETAGVN